MRKKILFPLLIAAGVVYSLVSSMAYDDARDQQDHYCKMVADGAWPAYDKSINCEGTEK